MSHGHLEVLLPEIRLHLRPIIWFLLEVHVSAEALIGGVGTLRDAQLVIGVGGSKDQAHRALKCFNCANGVLFLDKLAFK